MMRTSFVEGIEDARQSVCKPFNALLDVVATCYGAGQILRLSRPPVQFDFFYANIVSACDMENGTLTGNAKA